MAVLKPASTRSDFTRKNSDCMGMSQDDGKITPVLAGWKPEITPQSGKHTKNYGISPFVDGKINYFTLSITIFNSKLLVYQRVPQNGQFQIHQITSHGLGPHIPRSG